MSPDISFVISSYNSQAFILQCLASIIPKEIEIEVIIVDDASTDQTIETLQSATLDINFRLIEKSVNQGLLPSRLDGLAAATGKYIHFIDADDILLPRYWEVIPQALRSCPDIICFGYREFGLRHKVTTNNSLPGHYEDRFAKRLANEAVRLSPRDYSGVYPNVWGKLFKRNLLESIQRDISRSIFIGEDGRISYPALARSRHTFLTNQPLYGYRQHLCSTLRTSGSIKSEIKGLRHLLQELHKSLAPTIHDQVNWYVSTLLRRRMSPFELARNGVPIPEYYTSNRPLLLYGNTSYQNRLKNWLSETMPTKHCSLISDQIQLSKELAKFSGQITCEYEVDGPSTNLPNVEHCGKIAWKMSPVNQDIEYQLLLSILDEVDAIG